MLLLGMISKKIRKWCQTCKTLIHGRDVPVCAVQSIILDLWFARDLSGVHHPPLVKTYWRSRSTAVSWKGSACGIPGAAPEKKAYKFYTLRLMILNKIFNFGVNTESQALRRAWSRIPQNQLLNQLWCLLVLLVGHVSLLSLLPTCCAMTFACFWPTAFCFKVDFGAKSRDKGQPLDLSRGICSLDHLLRNYCPYFDKLRVVTHWLRLAMEVMWWTGRNCSKSNLK